MLASPVVVASSVAIVAAAVSASLIGRLAPRLPEVVAHAASAPRASRGRVVTAAGVAIVLVTLGAAAVVAFFNPAAGFRLAGVVVPAASVAAVSFFDDVRPLPALARLAVHVAAAAVTIQWLGPVEQMSLGKAGEVSLGQWAWPVTMLWIVGLTNTFNFMDGIDGMAGIVATAAGLAGAIALGLCGSAHAGFVAAAFAGAMSGFLAWNWPPARVFMGDVGSTFCGFFLAAMPLVLPGSARPASLVVAALATWPFVLDTGLTLLSRLARGQNVLKPHQSHLYQRMVAAGWSHRAVSALYGGLASFSAAVGLSALLARSFGV
jgi:UDP-N-acetylmuramyl pentapeptide phosphotransferase/UDP-N-acetylglucosamine-1-phosphate transferase